MEKNSYTIGEVAKMFNLSVSTLRYYDQEGLIPNLNKDASGHRKFNSENIDAIEIIECLKEVNMPLKDIKLFIKWNLEGDITLSNRLSLFINLDKTLKKRLERLEEISRIVDYKKEYYSQAVRDGTEKFVSKNKVSLLEIKNDRRIPKEPGCHTLPCQY